MIRGCPTLFYLIWCRVESTMDLQHFYHVSTLLNASMALKTNNYFARYPANHQWTTINVERFAGLYFRVFPPAWFSRVLRKFFCGYKHLSWITLNNEHFWPKQCESIIAKTLMGWNHEHLSQQIFPCLRYIYCTLRKVTL